MSAISLSPFFFTAWAPLYYIRTSYFPFPSLGGVKDFTAGVFSTASKLTGRERATLLWDRAAAICKPEFVNVLQSLDNNITPHYKACHVRDILMSNSPREFLLVNQNTPWYGREHTAALHLLVFQSILSYDARLSPLAFSSPCLQTPWTGSKSCLL